MFYYGQGPFCFNYICDVIIGSIFKLKNSRVIYRYQLENEYMNQLNALRVLNLRA